MKAATGPPPSQNRQRVARQLTAGQVMSRFRLWQTAFLVIQVFTLTFAYSPLDEKHKQVGSPLLLSQVFGIRDSVLYTTGITPQRMLSRKANRHAQRALLLLYRCQGQGRTIAMVQRNCPTLRICSLPLSLLRLPSRVTTAEHKRRCLASCFRLAHRSSMRSPCRQIVC